MKQPEIKHECVLGVTGSGKSHYIKTKILPKYFDRKDILKIIIDPEEEYEHLKIPSISLKNLNFKELVKKLAKHRAVRILIPPPLNKKEFDENLEKINLLYLFLLNKWREIYKLCKAKGIVLIIDEAQDCGADIRYLSFPLIALLKKGRKRNIKCILATQRVSYFSTDIRSQCRRKILFRVVEPIDIKRYKEISKEATELLLNSKKPYPHIVIEDGKIVEKDV
jgi:DNA segregation ATPase FtsK/SpoIIIE-like protein